MLVPLSRRIRRLVLVLDNQARKRRRDRRVSLSLRIISLAPPVLGLGLVPEALGEDSLVWEV